MVMLNDKPGKDRPHWWEYVLVATMLAIIVCVLLFADPAGAAPTAPFVDEAFLDRPTDLTGADFVWLWRTYGIPVRFSLVVLAKETSLGDYRHGGRLVHAYNYGGMVWSKRGATRSWGQLSSGRVYIADRYWFTFPDKRAGLAAWGRLIKTRYEAGHMDWDAFTDKYAEGSQRHLADLERIDAAVVREAREAGFKW